MDTYTVNPPQEGDIIVLSRNTPVILEVGIVSSSIIEGRPTWSIRAVPGSAMVYDTQDGDVLFGSCLVTEFPESRWFKAEEFPRVFSAYEKCTGV